jgi:hypothetical protein
MTAANRRTNLPSLSLLCLKEVAFIFFSRFFSRARAR